MAKYRFYRNESESIATAEFFGVNREDAIRIAEIYGRGILVEYRGGMPVAQVVSHPDGWYCNDWSETSLDPRVRDLLPPDLVKLDAKLVNENVDGDVEQGEPSKVLIFGIPILVLLIPGVPFGLLAYILCTFFLW